MNLCSTYGNFRIMNLCSAYGYFCIRISSETPTGDPNKHKSVISITNCISLKVIGTYYGLMSVSA